MMHLRFNTVKQLDILIRSMSHVLPCLFQNIQFQSCPAHFIVRLLSTNAVCCSLIEELQEQYTLAGVANPYEAFKAPPAAEEKFGFEWDFQGHVAAAWKEIDMTNEAQSPALKDKVTCIEGEDLLYDLLSGIQCMSATYCCQWFKCVCPCVSP